MCARVSDNNNNNDDDDDDDDDDGGGGNTRNTCNNQQADAGPVERLEEDAFRQLREFGEQYVCLFIFICPRTCTPPKHTLWELHS